MTSSRLLFLPSPLLLLIQTVSAAQLPYNPTTILTSTRNERVAYVFRPSSTSDPQAQLVSLDLTQQLNSSSLSLSTLYATLPFLNDNTAIPYTAFIDAGGNIAVFAGNCSSNNGGAQIWRLTAEALSEGGSGNWTQDSLTQSQGSSTASLEGPNFLAAGIAFSSNVTAESTNTGFYVFGGMCPWQNATADTWTASADYSGNMLALTPDTNEANDTKYGISLITSRNAPISEAGHSISPLPPTYSNQSDGSQTQQQNFLLIGGHTQNAFLNMSQIALYSLPEETWAFFPVDQPSSNGKTDLAVRQNTAQVESRSGHTAVLSADGKSVVVLGGWVGDVNTPATPQLAVLSVGEGYGGTGAWSWNIPSPTGSGLASGSGIYGHGAALLPGNVMLVLGGYNIPAPSSKFRFRSRSTNSETLNNQAYFYNITSNSWLTDYTAAAPGDDNGVALESKGPLSTTAEKAGLGTGLAVGGIAAVVLLIFYISYTRRLKRKREVREKEISELSFAAHRYESDEWGVGGIDERGGSATAGNTCGDREQAARESQPAYANSGYQPVSQQGWRNAGAQDAQRTGLLVEIPSPTRGLRRNVSGGRGPYPYEKRRSRIHPIAENEEEEITALREKQRDKDVRTSLLSKSESDPFMDGNQDSDECSGSPTKRNGVDTAEERQQQFEEWQVEWQRAEHALLSAPEMTPTGAAGDHGRVSPSKSDRTTSSLSENSSRSHISYRSGGGVLGIARALSIRSANLLSSIYNPAQGTSDNAAHDTEKGTNNDTPNITPSRYQAARGRSHTTSTLSTSPTRSRPQTGSSRPATSKSFKDAEADTLTTGKTSFAELQAQSESLLGSYSGSSTTKSALATLPSQQRHRTGYALPKSEPTSPVKEGTTKRVGWVDTVRRAFSGSGKPPIHLETSPSQSRHRHSESTSSTTPLTRARWDPTSGRSVSDASFWRSKRGARDWDYRDAENEDGAAGFPRYRDQVDVQGEQEGERNSGEWDVERAAENRVVQVMFTVPRGELRVVNADLSERGSLVSFEERERSGEERNGL